MDVSRNYTYIRPLREAACLAFTLFFAFAPYTLKSFIGSYIVIVMFLGIFAAIAFAVRLVWSLVLISPVRRITNPANALVHWNLEHGLWRRMRDLQYRRDARARKWRMIIVFILSLIIIGIPTIGFFLDDRSLPGLRVGLSIMAGINALFWLIIYVMPRIYFMKRDIPVFIARSGAVIGQRVCDWSDKDDEITLAAVETDPLPHIHIEYRISTSKRGYAQKIMVPIPPGRENEARHAVETIGIKS